MNTLAQCTQCKKQYDFSQQGESLLGDLNFCSDQCNCLWIALSERKSGKYILESKEWCDDIISKFGGNLNPNG
jgi:hypothetical protein